MARINVRQPDGTLGWFNPDSAEEIPEGTRWNGSNHVGCNSGLQCGYSELIRTSGGRWIVHTDARREFNGAETYNFLTDDQAREWLMTAGGDKAEEALKRYFGDLEEEAGPSAGGRPKVGPPISIALPDDLRERVDAARGGTSRAEWLRVAAEMRLAVEAASN